MDALDFEFLYKVNIQALKKLKEEIVNRHSVESKASKNR